LAESESGIFTGAVNVILFSGVLGTVFRIKMLSIINRDRSIWVKNFNYRGAKLFI